MDDVHNTNIKVKLFCSILIHMFDKYICTKTSKITKPRAPWLTGEIDEIIKQRVRLDRGIEIIILSRIGQRSYKCETWRQGAILFSLVRIKTIKLCERS